MDGSQGRKAKRHSRQSRIHRKYPRTMQYGYDSMPGYAGRRSLSHFCQGMMCHNTKRRKVTRNTRQSEEPKSVGLRVLSVGLRVLADGNKYEGSWFKNKPHGDGTMYYRSGDTYRGQFKDGEKNGFGSLTPADKNALAFEGFWVSDMLW